MMLCAVFVGLIAMTACGGAVDVDCDDGYEERDGACHLEDGDDDDDDVVGGPLTEEQFARQFAELLCAEYETCNDNFDCDPEGNY